MIMTEKQFKARLAQIVVTHEKAMSAMQSQIAVAAAAMDSHAYLVSIERVERRVIFTFMVNKELKQVETIGTWADNIEQWKKDLGLTK